MTYIVVAHKIVLYTAYILMAYVVMAYKIVACIVMAYVLLAFFCYGLYSYGISLLHFIFHFFCADKPVWLRPRRKKNLCRNAGRHVCAT